MSWVSVSAESCSALSSLIEGRVESRIKAGEFLQKDIDYIANLKRPALDGAVGLSDVRLEKLRRLCQLWDIDIRPMQITSHRKIIGPVIVAIKRLTFPIIKMLLKDFIRQQRDFNASAILLLAELSREESTQRPTPAR